MLHPPGADLLLARLRQRQKKQAAAAQQQETKELIEGVLGFPPGGKRGQAGKGGGRKPK
jgi:hypothetical protein